MVVGWINANTNQGGVDDYFLSGEVTCSDGAESCPDSTKQVFIENNSFTPKKQNNF